MHLAARCHREHAACGAFNCVENASDAGDRALPPVGRALLGAAERRHELVVLAGAEGERPALEIKQRCADAPRSEVDGEQKVLFARLRRKAPWPNRHYWKLVCCWSM